MGEPTSAAGDTALLRESRPLQSAVNGVLYSPAATAWNPQLSYMLLLERLDDASLGVMVRGRTCARSCTAHLEGFQGGLESSTNPANPEPRGAAHRTNVDQFSQEVECDVEPNLHLLTPAANALMASIRGVGYDTRTAVADLIDNSIAAASSTVWVSFYWAGADATVAILDDGCGMTSDQLDAAMTFGSRHPDAERHPSDLGRFGLGLKTASLSQCRRLVVASKPEGGAISVRAWDLDTVASTNGWFVETECAGQTEADLIDQLKPMKTGTLVLWRHLDRLTAGHQDDEPLVREDFQKASFDVSAHLAMIFHRFLEGNAPRLRLYVNGTDEEFRVRPWDPFYRSSTATQLLPEARRRLGGAIVELQGAVLPHKDRIPAAEYEQVGGTDGWLAHEGFYVYRGQRLLVPGSWLGLGRPKSWGRDEQHKLARIRLDIPNVLDAEWKIDIRKSRATPPRELREWLTRNATQVREQAREVFVHRGERAPVSHTAVYATTWLPGSGSAPAYYVNRTHAAVAECLRANSSPRQVEAMLRLLEATVPVHRIWLDVSEKPEAPAEPRTRITDDQVMGLARDLLERLMRGARLSRRDAVARLKVTEPFDHYPAVLALIEEE